MGRFANLPGILLRPGTAGIGMAFSDIQFGGLPSYNPAMPTITLSAAALALFRLHVERQGQIAVDDSTREPYRELARAGLMRAGSTFRDGEESIYRLTQEGFERKAELFGCAKESA